MLFYMFLFRLLMRNVLTICVLICPIKCVSLYPVFRLNIHVFHAFGIFNVFVSLCICVVLIICEFICFFLHFLWYLYIHVICKHILLVWFFFTSLKNSCSLQIYIISFLVSSPPKHPIPAHHLHISRRDLPMCVKKHPGPIKTSNTRIQSNVVQVSGASRAPSAAKGMVEPVFFENERNIKGTSVFLVLCFFLLNQNL